MHDAQMYLKPEDESFFTFLYNSKKKEVLGRTAESWGKITAFYIVYYAFLAAFFAALLAVFYQTLDTRETGGAMPTYAFPESILKNPALGFRPLPEQVTSTLIHFTQANSSTYQHYNDALNKYINEIYGITEGKTSAVPSETTPETNCDFSQYENDINNVFERAEKCQFDPAWLSLFNGKSTSCNDEQDWGYGMGHDETGSSTLCVIIKMNKIINWIRELPDDAFIQSDSTLDENMPESLKWYIGNFTTVPKMIWLSCSGETPDNSEHILKTTMLPYQGFLASHLDYMNQDVYYPPTVAVEFEVQKYNLINVVCRLWANDVGRDLPIINYNPQDSLGTVEFEIVVD